MLTLGIDPASTTQPGYAVLAFDATALVTPRVVYLGDTLPPGPFDVAAVEGQWQGGRASPLAVAALAFDAGYRLALAPAPTKYRIPPAAWRTVLWPSNGGSLPKAVVVARLRQMLSLEGRGTDDEIEAAGLALAVFRLTAGTPKALKKYLVRK